MNYFFAPHSDDEALFGSFIIQRFKPRIVVCTDGTSHERKFGISIETRRNESRKAAQILGVGVEFLGIPEEDVTKERLVDEFNKYLYPDDDRGIIFVPAKTGGHPHHDIVSDVGSYYPSVIYYSTYAQNDLTMRGEMALLPTLEESDIKNRVLDCYESQIFINGQHFEAVKGKPEYLNSKQC